jgi:hypothetical protein
VEAELLRGLQPAHDLSPRCVVVAGAESRLMRAVIEPICPVPLVAWSFGSLPGWVGPLDLVVVLSSEQTTEDELSTIIEARRRGCSLIVAANKDSAAAVQSASRATTLLPTRTGDPLAACVVVLGLLAEMGLGPQVRPESVAEAVDMVAEECSPHRNLSNNPAKNFALELAEANPLVWGGSVLSGRASRRIAEALRRNSGRPALAADACELLPVIRATAPPDPFADPFEGGELRPALVICEDGDVEQSPGEQQLLENWATNKQIRITKLRCDYPDADPVDRYASVLQQGRFGASYLGIGLGTAADPVEGLWEPGR